MSNREKYRQKFASYPDLVNLIQFREMLGGIADSTARKLMRENRVKHYYIRTTYLIPKEWVIDYHLRDISLSLKAKGLLSLMLSLPEGWDYTTKGLACICKDGVDSICSTVKELEKAGYVQRRRLRNELGHLTEIEYTILEKPVRPSSSENLSQPDSSANTGTPPKREKPVLDYPVLDKPEQAFPEQAIPEQEEPEQENPAQLNIQESITEKSITDLSSKDCRTGSIPGLAEKSVPGGNPEPCL